MGKEFDGGYEVRPIKSARSFRRYKADPEWVIEVAFVDRSGWTGAYLVPVGGLDLKWIRNIPKTFDADGVGTGVSARWKMRARREVRTTAYESTES